MRRLISRSNSWILAFCVPAALAVGGCRGDAAGALATIERDSAAITIVENGPVTAAAQYVTVDPLPQLEIGQMDGPPEYQLFRVVSAHRLSDGRLVIANSGSHELRFYGPDGSHLLSVGGEGEGPGEFTQLYRTWVRADSLWAYDVRNRAFSVFGLDGGFARTYAVGGDNQFSLPNALFSDGGSLVQINRVFRAGEATGGVDRQNRIMTVYDRDGDLEAELGEWPGNEMFVIAEADLMAVRSLTFGRGLYSTISQDRVVIGTNDTLSFEIRGRDGSLERLIRVQEPMRPVEPGAFEQVRDGVVEDGDESMRATWRKMFDAMPRHETYPAFRLIVCDSEGRIWLEDYRAPGDDRRAWTVFSREGHALGRVRTPDGLDVLEIGSDYVLGVVRDKLEVEYVRLHALNPSEPLESGARADSGTP